MRRLTKAQRPTILEQNEAQWVVAVLENPSETNKTRYRHPDIKARLVEETGEKCVYCESNMRPVTPSHVEHKIPASKEPSLRFSWDNLTICCPECNRRKGDFYDAHTGFLDPYTDDVESMLIHRGPVVGWAPGAQRAELSVKYLGLDGSDRVDLILRKVEKINEIDDMIERYHAHKGGPLEIPIRKRLKSKSDKMSEYSAMVRSIFSMAGLNELVS